MYNKIMKYEWDEHKKTVNLDIHHVDFAVAYEFEWDTAIAVIDDRNDCGELRVSALGLVGDCVYNMVYTMRGDAI